LAEHYRAAIHGFSMSKSKFDKQADVQSAI